METSTPQHSFLKYFLSLMAIIVTLIIGIAAGEFKGKQTQDSQIHTSGSENITIKVDSRIDVLNVETAIAFNKESPDLKIVGWTLDGHYPIYNIKEDPANPLYVLFGGKRELATGMKEYIIPPLLESDLNGKYFCDVLCKDQFGNVVATNPKK